ncbi:MAG: protein kinase [Blastocatellales bacterium]|nr:protein kinase [Blastocatellales bacterium]
MSSDRRREISELADCTLTRAAEDRAETDPALAADTNEIDSSDAASQSIIGRTIGAYRLRAQLGAGGMGVVYLAEDVRLGRSVAIKLLPPDASSPDRVRRFLREAQAASALNHPNIVTLYDIGESSEGHYIVMEHISGRTLRETGRQRLTSGQIAEIGIQAARALEVAHASGIIHRDIKPENLMLREDGYLKVLDFGLARLVNPLTLEPESASNDETQPGVIVGTLSYLSPEQARGERVRTSTDIFSLGIVLYELATGQRPFRGATPMQLIEAITTVPPFAPTRLVPELPATLESLLLRMLDKDPRRRPSAAEVAAALSGEVATLSTAALGPPPGFVRAPLQATVGRAEELNALRDAFKYVESGRGLMVCITGEPGIGKSTVVESFLSELEAAPRSCRIARGRCSERLAGAEAYLPFLEMLDSLFAGRERERVAQVMKLLAPTWYSQVSPLPSNEPSLSGGELKSTSQERMKRELALFLTELAGEKPLVLFLDDLHWADPSTTDLLAYLATKFDSSRLLVITTHRPSDLLLAKHPFLAVKLELQARGAARELPLDFLGAGAIAQFLDLEFPGHRFDPEFAALLHQKTEGNPLFVTDLVRELRERGVIAHNNGQWSLERDFPEFERELPASVRSLIQRKIDRLDESDRALLAAAGVQGVEFDSAVAARALELDPLEVEERLEDLERVHAFIQLIAEQEMPDRTLSLRYRFVHVLYQNALYGSLRPTRRAQLSRAVAAALEGFYRRQSPEIAAELALLYEAARAFAPAVDYFLAAAQKASRVFANQEAAHLGRRALDLLGSLPEGPERDSKELAAQMTLGVALMSLRGFGAPEVESAYSRARQLVEQLGDQAPLFNVLYGLWTVSVIRTRYAEAHRLADRMMNLAQHTADSSQLVQAHYALGITLDYLGEYTLARKHLEEVRALYDPRGHRSHASVYGIDPMVVGGSRLSWILWVLGETGRARELMDEVYQLARSIRHPLSLGCALVTAAVMHELYDEPQRALDLADEIIALSSEHGLVVTHAWGLFERGYARARLGESAAGADEMRQSLSTLRAIGCEMGISGFLVLLADALCDADRIDEALEVIDEASALMTKTGERYYEADLLRLRGELLAVKAWLAGDEALTGLAKANLRRSIDVAQARGARTLEQRATDSLSKLEER